jgi:serine/threonine protein kinase
MKYIEIIYKKILLFLEVIKDEKDLISIKSEIRSLGVIIYYLLFKEYPYQGKDEYQLIKDINSNKKLKSTDNKELNDLLNKMLEKNSNNRISWQSLF